MKTFEEILVNSDTAFDGAMEAFRQWQSQLKPDSKTGMVYREVKVEDELPKEENNYPVKYKSNNYYSTCYFNGKRFECSPHMTITSWLKPEPEDKWDWDKLEDEFNHDLIPSNGNEQTYIATLAKQDAFNWLKQRLTTP